MADPGAAFAAREGHVVVLSLEQQQQQQQAHQGRGRGRGAGRGRGGRGQQLHPDWAGAEGAGPPAKRMRLLDYDG
jgi:hypothetical protein